jgi:hypothetical protein
MPSDFSPRLLAWKQGNSAIYALIARQLSRIMKAPWLSNLALILGASLIAFKNAAARRIACCEFQVACLP